MHLQGYAEGIVEGKTVQRGELIAYVGRTGIKESAAHLHLPVYPDHSFARGEFLDPYGLLVQLCNGQGVTDLGQPAHRPPPNSGGRSHKSWDGEAFRLCASQVSRE